MQDDGIAVEERLDWGDEDDEDLELMSRPNYNADSSNLVGENSSIKVPDSHVST